MTPQNERRKMNFLSWVVPALLAVITGLIVAGGSSIIDIMRSQANNVDSLRRDFGLMQIQVAHLEDAINNYQQQPIVIHDQVPKAAVIKPTLKDKSRR